MALIKCNECGNEISDMAEVCPHCGCPTKSDNKNSIQKHKKQMIIAISAIIGIAIAIVLIIVLILAKKDDKKTRLEKIVYDDFQTLKKMEGDNIQIKDALYFYSESDVEGETNHQVLIVYTKGYREKYAGFDTDGDYLGDGSDISNSKDMEEAWGNFIVSLLIVEYEQYVEGETILVYNSKGDTESIIKESDIKNYNRGVVIVPISKIK